jgi:hypothetical protein
MIKKISSGLLVVVLATLAPRVVLAHCPLCTIGAGALAVLAASLGISTLVVGVAIGAFALALGLWLARLPKKNYFSYQYLALVVLIFLATIIPIMPLVRDYGPLYVSLGGPYGSLWHNTYTINLFVAGSLLGALLMLAAPYLSRWLTRLRGGQTWPYQGLSLTFALLVVVGLLIQFWPLLF